MNDQKHSLCEKNKILLTNLSRKELKTEFASYMKQEHPSLPNVRKSDFFQNHSQRETQTKTENREIAIRNFEFTPKEIQINTNSQITWRVGDNLPLYSSKVYSMNERCFYLYIEELDVYSPGLSKGDTFTYKFSQPGLFKVSCENYSRMFGFIKVLDNEKDLSAKIPYPQNFHEGKKSLEYLGAKSQTSSTKKAKILEDAYEDGYLLLSKFKPPENIIALGDIERQEAKTRFNLLQEVNVDCDQEEKEPCDWASDLFEDDDDYIRARDGMMKMGKLEYLKIDAGNEVPLFLYSQKEALNESAMPNIHINMENVGNKELDLQFYDLRRLESQAKQEKEEDKPYSHEGLFQGLKTDNYLKGEEEEQQDKEIIGVRVSGHPRPFKQEPLRLEEFETEYLEMKKIEVRMTEENPSLLQKGMFPEIETFPGISCSSNQEILKEPASNNDIYLNQETSSLNQTTGGKFPQHALNDLKQSQSGHISKPKVKIRLKQQKKKKKISKAKLINDTTSERDESETNKVSEPNEGVLKTPEENFSRDETVFSELNYEKIEFLLHSRENNKKFEIYTTENLDHSSSTEITEWIACEQESFSKRLFEISKKLSSTAILEKSCMLCTEDENEELDLEQQLSFMKNRFEIERFFIELNNIDQK